MVDPITAAKEAGAIDLLRPAGLKPCPFNRTHMVRSQWVGERGEDEGGYWAVECRDCNGANGRFVGVHEDDQATAERRWNERAD